MSECAWEPTANFGSDKTLLKEFYHQAKHEGLDWKANNTIILNEAVEGGYCLSPDEKGS